MTPPPITPPTADFVTYRQLISYFLTTVALVLLIFGLYASHMETKVSRELYNRDYTQFCSDIADIQKTTKSNQMEISTIGKNQLLVLRHLKITPVP